MNVNKRLMASAAYPLPSFLVQASGRVSTRVAAIFPVELVVPGSESPDLLVRSVDVGMGGLCVRTLGALDASKVHRIRFSLGRHDLDFKVEVRWQSPPGSVDGPLLGFSFAEMDATSERSLWHFIQERGHELATFLRSCGGLRHLDFQDAIELALTTRIREVERGEFVYGGTGHSPCASIFALFRGNVLLERVHGERSQEIDVVEPGEFFGGIPLIAGCVLSERAVATSPSTLLEFVEYNTNYLLNTKPPLGASLVRATSFHWVQRLSRVLDRLYEKESPE
jgi:hypothetical protein